MSTNVLREAYQDRFDQILHLFASQLREHILDVVGEYPRIDQVTVRAKTVDRFLQKAERTENGEPKYPDPINQIQDQLAARIVTLYISDLNPISEIIKDFFGSVEEKLIVPDSENEFGYEGLHYILFIPEALFTPNVERENCPQFFELQVSTLFQHAWAEANHDLGFKPPSELAVEQKRKIAFTSAQAWGADFHFNELAKSLLGGNVTESIA